MLYMGRLYMKENNAFLFVGNMPSFGCLLDDVLSISSEEWARYRDRRVGVAAGKTDTIPLIYDNKHRCPARKHFFQNPPPTPPICRYSYYGRSIV